MSKIFKQVGSVFFLALAMFLLLIAITRGQGGSPEQLATGGPFILQKFVVAGGGKEKQVQPMSENGTAGQSVAGQYSQSGQYNIRSGFWTPDDLAPTAAEVSISGRVTTSNGRGIQNIRVTLTSLNGTSRSVLTSSFGYYKIADIEVGHSYILAVSAKRFVFDESQRVIQLDDELNNCDFVASGNPE